MQKRATKYDIARPSFQQIKTLLPKLITNKIKNEKIQFKSFFFLNLKIKNILNTGCPSEVLFNVDHNQTEIEVLLNLCYI